MIAFNIYQPPIGESDPDGSAIKFLPDGKSWIAAFVPPLWLIWNRLWWALGVYLAFSAVIVLLAITSFREAAIILSALPGLYLLLEGHELVRQKYESKGWVHTGVIHGSNLEDAELRYFLSRQAQSNPSGRGNISLIDTEQTMLPEINHPKPARSGRTDGLFPLDDIL